MMELKEHRREWRFLVSVLIAIVAVSTVVGVGAADLPERPETTCDGVTVQNDDGDSTMVAVVPDGTTYTTGETAHLYPGTTLHIVVCTGSGPVETGPGGWQFDGTSSFTVVAEENTYRTIEVGTENVTLTEISGQNPDGELTVAVPDGMIHTRDNESLLLAGEGEARTFSTAEENFRENVSTAENAAATLSAQAAAIETGEVELTEETVSELRDNVSRMNGSYQEALSSESAIERQLFNRMMTRPQPDQSVATMGRIDKQSDDMNESIGSATARYNGAVSTIQRNTQQSVLLSLGIGLILGLMVGGGLGAYKPYVEGKEVADFADWNPSDYDNDVVRLPVLAGILVLVVGLIALVVTGIVGVFV